MDFQDILDAIAEIPYLLMVIYLIIIAAAAIIVERILTRQIKRFTRGKDLPPEVTNGLLLIARLIVLLGAVSAAFSVGGIPADWVVSVSAVAGAAIGFASTRTIGNLLAGLYVMISRPFRVQDYVQIGGTEGIVKEITINYTKILTPGGQIVSFSNQKILDQVITNFRVEGERRKLYCYAFEVVFDHSLPLAKLDEVFNAVINEYSKELPKQIEYKLIKLTRLERTYRIHLYVKRPEDIFTYYPRVLDEITRLWEKAKAEAS
ncbi:MAG TPA: mechanosensitive ion channel family protein [Candidatus Bathyarchaeota archaeon]|nr:mechanosensitive ion channel family protein [Candidatus Bathyarchaeota archaeon]